MAVPPVRKWISTTTAGDKLTVLHHPPGYALRRNIHGYFPGACPASNKWEDQIKNWDEVRAYQEAAARKSDFERTEVAKDKTGVRLDGVAAINPVNGKEIPIFISDYVLITYGTGAIMAVPAPRYPRLGICEEI